MNYIHQYPVNARIVEEGEEYLYRSCDDFYGTGKELLELDEECI